MLLIHLKQEDMLELIRSDKKLVEAISKDVDKDGNNWAHIALLYSKQEVFSELIERLPELYDGVNNHGDTVYDFLVKYDRSRKLDDRSYTKIMGSPKSQANTDADLSESSTPPRRNILRNSPRF